MLRASFNYSVVRHVEDEGIEPSTLGLQSRCSPAELIPRGRAPDPHGSVSQDRIDSIESFEIDRNRPGSRPEQDSRKEVIQPQVPLRLPCYDFTPVTSHSLGGCLTRLAHRLLEQLTPMV